MLPSWAFGHWIYGWCHAIYHLQSHEVVGAFDYGSLPPEIAEDLRLDAGCIREARDVMEAIFKIGSLLTWAKEVLAHGQFIRWVRAECGFSISSAENYIRANNFVDIDDRIATVAILPVALYLISAKNAPPEIVKAVLARAAGGEPVPAAEVKRMIRELKDRNRQGTQGNGRRELRRASASKPRMKWRERMHEPS